MRDLADALGIKAASLYNHISSKEDILTILVIETAEKFTQGMNQIKAENIPSSDKIKKIIQHHIDLTVENPGAMAALNNDWMHLEEKRAYFLKMRQDYEDNFREILQNGINRDEIHPYDIDITLFSLLSTLRALHIWYSKKDHIDVAVLREEIPELLLRGILK